MIRAWGSAGLGSHLGADGRTPIEGVTYSVGGQRIGQYYQSLGKEGVAPRPAPCWKSCRMPTPISSRRWIRQSATRSCWMPIAFTSTKSDHHRHRGRPSQPGHREEQCSQRARDGDRGVVGFGLPRDRRSRAILHALDSRCRSPESSCSGRNSQAQPWDLSDNSPPFLHGMLPGGECIRATTVRECASAASRLPHGRGSDGSLSSGSYSLPVHRSA